MKLERLHVQNFRCVRDSGEFKVHPSVTCLVGKNESGKTTILEALSLLNPLDEDKKLTSLDFPRHKKTELEEENEKEPVLMLSSDWTLEPADQEYFAELLGDESKKLSAAAIELRYDNELHIDIGVSEDAMVRHLVHEHSLSPEDRGSLGTPATVQSLKKALAALPERNGAMEALLKTVTKRFGEKTGMEVLLERVRERVPKIAYFSEFLRLPGQVSLADFKRLLKQKALTDDYQVFHSLLLLAGKKADDLENAQKFEDLQADLEGISNRLTQTIFKYWTQNKSLKIQFRFDHGKPQDPQPYNEGYVLRTRVENLRHGVSTSLDVRSTGFRWFFSFLVWFSQIRKTVGTNVLLLLDEPGLSLHGTAQADLLRFIEEQLAPHHQVIYTTHSPFMVDAEKFDRARTVEDVQQDGSQSIFDASMELGDDAGTKVGSDVLSVDRDTLFPLQACLGYEVTQSLFIGKYVLLVEGPSDLLYLKWFQRKLKELGRAYLDPRWVITPVGGITKVAAFVSLFRAAKIEIAVLTDFQDGDRKKVRDLRESKILKSGRVFSAEQYAQKNEADTEDMLGDAVFVETVNDTYGLKDAQRLAIPSPGTDGKTGRIVKHAEQHFATLPPNSPTFDHFAPAELFTAKGLSYQPASMAQALNNFERFFKDVNATLDT